MTRNISKTPGPGLGFLLSQVGAHSSACYAERIAPLGLKPYHTGILRILSGDEGLTQQSLCGLLGMFPSRLVGLIDELQKMKLVERRERPNDRRTYALFLTKAGREMLAKVREISQQVQEDLCAALNAKERALLTEMLTRIVEQQRINPAIHPAYRQMGRDEATREQT